MPTKETPQPKTPLKTEGQRLLREVPESAGKIAAALGCSRPLVSYWRSGKKVPGGLHRQSLETHFGIPVTAWETAPGATPPKRTARAKKRSTKGKPEPKSKNKGKAKAAPASRAKAGARPSPPQPSSRVHVQEETHPPRRGGYPPTPSDDAPSTEILRYQLACIRHDLDHLELDVASRSKLRGDETRAIGMLAKIEKEMELREARYVYEHPAWLGLRVVILRALKPYPEASQAVLDALVDTEAGGGASVGG